MANIFTAIVTAFKGGKLAIQGHNLAVATRKLRLNVQEKIMKYIAANGDIPDDIKSILRDLDGVTERAADIVDTIGLDGPETRLRGYIKPEMYN